MHYVLCSRYCVVLVMLIFSKIENAQLIHNEVSAKQKKLQNLVDYIDEHFAQHNQIACLYNDLDSKSIDSIGLALEISDFLIEKSSCKIKEFAFAAKIDLLRLIGESDNAEEELKKFLKVFPASKQLDKLRYLLYKSRMIELNYSKALNLLNQINEWPDQYQFYREREYLLELLDDEIGAAIDREQSEKIMLGKKAIDQNLTDIDGDQYRLEDFSGKILIINFWEPNFDYCIKKLKELKILLVYLKNTNVLLLNISITSSVDSIRNTVNKYFLPGKFFKCSENLLHHVGIIGVPQYVIVDQQGRIIDKSMGGTTSQKYDVLYMANLIEELSRQNKKPDFYLFKIWELHGDNLWRQNNKKGAANYYEKSLNYFKRNLELQLKLAEYYKQINKTDDAKLHFDVLSEYLLKKNNIMVNNPSGFIQFLLHRTLLFYNSLKSQKKIALELRNLQTFLLARNKNTNHSQLQ